MQCGTGYNIRILIWLQCTFKRTLSIKIFICLNPMHFSCGPNLTTPLCSNFSHLFLTVQVATNMVYATMKSKILKILRIRVCLKGYEQGLILIPQGRIVHAVIVFGLTFKLYLALTYSSNKIRKTQIKHLIIICKNLIGL